MIENGEFYFGDDMASKIHLQLQEEENSEASPKIKWACDKARSLAKEGKKQLYGVILETILNILKILFKI